MFARFLIIFLCSALFSKAQFAPQAGVSGSTAVHKSDLSIKAWASECRVVRGPQQIGVPGSPWASVGDSTAALGAADGSVVSLGDGGTATLHFPGGLYNGPGADFAVFENGFVNPANSEEAYLELAFVEVSSDGIHFVRFPATSLTPKVPQIRGAGDYMNARNINNLAGKYISGYGTPFDLDELKAAPNLDVNAVRYVRLTDVVGATDEHATFDNAGNVVNDPFPSPFPSCGFDLDAVAAMNIKPLAVAESGASHDFTFGPNPATDKLFVQFDIAPEPNSIIYIFDVLGKKWANKQAESYNTFSIAELPAGMYCVQVSQNDKILCTRRFIKN